MSGKLVSPPTKSHPSDLLMLCDTPLFDLPSTDDEISVDRSTYVTTENIDRPNAPFATFKVFYRPRGSRSFVHSRAPAH